MIERVGVDVVEIARIERAMANPRFADRILTLEERNSLQPLTPARVAGRWAAKEAIAKAVSKNLKWHDVAIFNDPAGRPQVVFLQPAGWLEGHRIHLSISHSRVSAVAMVVLERIS